MGEHAGVSPNYGDITNIALREGRFITEADDQQRANVMVVGVNAADALFPYSNGIAARKCAWVATISRSSVCWRSGRPDSSARTKKTMLFTFSHGTKDRAGKGYLLMVIRGRTGQVQEALTQAEEILRRRRQVKFGDPNNFDIKTADKFIEQFDSITAMVGLIAIAISSLGLLVGGIGVMNIMLVSVTERTKEIECVKRSEHDAEILFVSFLRSDDADFSGGALGVLLAVGIAQLLIFIFPSMPATIPAWAVITGLTVSIGVGLIFGVWPARKASRLDPIECLRYE